MMEIECIIVPRYKGKYIVIKNKVSNKFEFQKITITTNQKFSQLNVVIKREISKKIQEMFPFCDKNLMDEKMYKILALRKFKVFGVERYVVIMDFNSYTFCNNMLNYQIFSKSIKSVTDCESKLIMQKIEKPNTIMLSVVLFIYMIMFLFIGITDFVNNKNFIIPTISDMISVYAFLLISCKYLLQIIMKIIKFIKNSMCYKNLNFRFESSTILMMYNKQPNIILYTCSIIMSFPIMYILRDWIDSNPNNYNFDALTIIGIALFFVDFILELIHYSKLYKE